jgi:hypothetical protein
MLPAPSRTNTRGNRLFTAVMKTALIRLRTPAMAMEFQVTLFMRIPPVLHRRAHRRRASTGFVRFKGMALLQEFPLEQLEVQLGIEHESA